MQLKGTVGNKGYAKGVAKVIKQEADLEKVAQGDILVLEQGNAAIIKVVSKISGIITDHGGLTSHAALLAREHNLPCVIGAQTATRGIKDGQLVELNAETGIINF
ncbi:MAG: PEP-utilizing enzyme [Patescibacteria group bacterium]|nr:PEP-utilizing enzyme [Patescibacteria group bacterium]